MGSHQTWQTRVAEKQATQLGKIPKAWHLPSEFLTGDETCADGVMDIPAKCGILSAEELHITEDLDAVALAKAVQLGTIKAKLVATAFCKRAAIAQQLTNCLTETMFEEAIKRGEFLDEYLESHGKPLGPLHGVPISLKESFDCAGVQSTMGLVSYLDKPAHGENGATAAILIDLGAILYCKTNISQTLMSSDSHNNVFGRTLNPHKLSLGAGGSSGGEGALVALRGSILGVGTDMAGSVRIPALCNGTYGFKPSTGRVPFFGSTFCHRMGSPGFPPVAGPLSCSYEGMALFLQAVIESHPWNRDPLLYAIPWRAEVAASVPKKLRIGYMLEDAKFPVHPPVRRAMESSAQALAQAGHEVIPLSELPSLETGLELGLDACSFDNTVEWKKHVDVSGEPVVPSLRDNLPLLTRKVDKGGYTIDDIFAHNAAKLQYKAGWNVVFARHQLDVLICPGAETTAVPHDTIGAPPYTSLFSLLEFPAVILPVGRAMKDVDRDDLAPAASLRPCRNSDADRSDLVDGAPTAIQVVSRSFRDEELLAAGRVIDQCLRKANSPSWG
ncbi:general amidase GmdB [Apiospora sp. TS-2023a]